MLCYFRFQFIQEAKNTKREREYGGRERARSGERIFVREYDCCWCGLFSRFVVRRINGNSKNITKLGVHDEVLDFFSYCICMNSCWKLFLFL